ncbi:hypothetical protein KSP40_PGU003937 [Platanthera guangdongensis]|uniref:DUF3741 domain-containing protein n=1 Tax=Platanthera guangdongensis TaxID=2320717 RepID=A0ABR2N181_9ASPA
MEVRDSSELQLLEVSRRVRKLTQIIDSWSKAPNLDARSKYVAKDLLRGSLALQESLITIRRLQETSRMMSLVSRQETCFSVEKRANGSETCSSLGFGGLYGDIRSVIKVKVEKQNLVSIFSNDHEIAARRDVSCQNIGMRDELARATPNLIAKLMGLKKNPSQSVGVENGEEKNGNRLSNIYKQAHLDNENSGIQSGYTICVGRQPVNQRQAALQFPHDNRREIPMIQKQKKSNPPAEVSLKHEVSSNEHRDVKRLVKRMDRDSAGHSPKSNTLAFVTRKLQRKESICTNDKASERRKSVQFTSASSLSQAGRIEPPPIKPDKIFAAAKGGAKIVNSIPSNSYRKEDSKKGGRVSIVFNNNEQTAVNTKCKRVAVKRTKPTSMNTALCSSSSSPPIHHGLPQQLAENSTPFFRDTRMGGKRFCEIMPVISSKCGKNRVVSVKPDMPNCSTEAVELQKDVKMQLLSCPEFLTVARQMFGYEVQLHQAKTNQSLQNFDKERRTNSHEHILGFAMELIARRKYQLELSYHPMFLIDDLYYKLERDLRCTNLFLSSTWDFGWVGWFCAGEIDVVVNRVEERIISELLGEVAVDLVH